MTLIMSDGFDLYSTPALAGWVTSISGNGGTSKITGRTLTGQAWQIAKGNSNGGTSGASFNIAANYSTLIVGVAWSTDYNPGVFSTERIIGFLDGTTEQMSVRYNNSNQLLVTRNGTVLATETVGSTVSTVYYYLEFKVTFAGASAGSFSLRRNGSLITGISDNAAVTTITTANAFANQIVVMNISGAINPGSMYYDDLYLCDNAGSVNNTFLGDTRVIGLVPNGVGTNTNWTKVGAAATNWQSTNEIPPDGDTTYVKSATVGQIDTYTYTDLPATAATVFAVNSRFDMRRDDAGARTATTRVRSGGTEADASGSVTPSLSYFMTNQIMETNPVTAAAWTPSEVNAAEFGPKILT